MRLVGSNCLLACCSKRCHGSVAQQDTDVAGGKKLLCLRQLAGSFMCLTRSCFLHNCRNELPEKTEGDISVESAQSASAEQASDERALERTQPLSNSRTPVLNSHHRSHKAGRTKANEIKMAKCMGTARSQFQVPVLVRVSISATSLLRVK